MTGVSTPSVLQLVVDALLAAPTVQALVGNDIRGAWARSSDLGTIPRPSVVVEIDGGSAMYVGPASYSLSIHVLSDSGMDEAFSVYEACRDVLHAEALCHATNGHRASSSEIVRPNGGWFAGAACWWVVGRYTLVVVRT